MSTNLSANILLEGTWHRLRIWGRIGSSPRRRILEQATLAAGRLRGMVGHQGEEDASWGKIQRPKGSM